MTQSDSAMAALAARSSSSQDMLSTGMVQLLTPVVEQCDTRIAAVLATQKALIAQIEQFSSELAKAEQQQEGELSDELLGAYAAKLAGSRKKLKKVEMLMMQTRDRVENVERMHEQLLASEKSFKDRIEGKSEEAIAQPATQKADTKSTEKSDKNVETKVDKQEEPKAAEKEEPNEAAKESSEELKNVAAEENEEGLHQEDAEQEGGEGVAVEDSAAEGDSGKKKKKKK